MRAASRILVRSEFRRRRRTYAFLGGVFAFATAALLLLLGAANGVFEAIGEELEDTLSSEYRLADGRPDELAEGFFFPQAGGAAERAALAMPGAAAAPRIEVQGIFLHTSRYEDFDAGLLVGVDAARDGGASDVAGRIVSGRFLDGETIWIGGKPYAQLVVGSRMLEILGMEVYDGALNPTNVLNVTAGRFSTEGSEVRPVVREGVVVGAFETGFGPVDRYTVFLHIGVARELLRIQFDDDLANVLLVRSADESAVRRFAAAEGLNVSTSAEFRDRYLSAVFDPVRAFAAVSGLVVLAVAGGWVANVAAAAVLSDRSRVAVLRALGVPTRLVVGPLAGLVVLAGLLGALLGLALGEILALAIEATGVRVPGLPEIRLSVGLPPALAAGLALAVLATAALASLGAWFALRRIPVTEALRG